MYVNFLSRATCEKEIMSVQVDIWMQDTDRAFHL